MTTYAFDFTSAARSGGVFTAPPAWLSISCSSTNRTVQTSATRVVSGLGANAWRARYVGAPGTFPGLSVECQRTNAHARSCSGTTGWVSAGTPHATLTSVTGPDGVVGGAVDVAWTNNEVYGYVPVDVRTALPGLVSAWVKGVSGTSAVELLDGASLDYDAKRSINGNWSRCTLAVGSQTSTTWPGYGRGTLQATSGEVQVWGEMVEAGALYPSSVIPTTTASVTRSADVLSGSGPELFPGGTCACTLQVAPNFASGEATSDAHLIWWDANNHVRLRASDQAVVVTVGGTQALASPTLTWSREQPITITLVDTAVVGLRVTIAGATAGNGTVSAPFATMSSPTTVYFLGSSAGAEECFDLQVITVDIATRLELINQDPEPGDVEGSLTVVELDVVDGGSAGPNPNATDVRVFRALPISSAAPSSDGASTILTFASPHLLAPAPVTSVSISAAPNTPAPTTVTTATAHGLITGQYASIGGVLGNTAVNGTWSVTRTSANTFTIPVAGNAAYLGGGTVVGPVGQLVPVTVAGVVGLGLALNAAWTATILDGYRVSVPYAPTPGSSYVSGGTVTPTPTPIASVSAGATSPIVLTFAQPHGLGPVGATVTAFVSDVGAENPAANGDWTATVASSTTLTLPGTGTAGAAGGPSGGTLLVGLSSSLAYHAGAIQSGWSGSAGLLSFDAGTLTFSLSPTTPLAGASPHLVRVLANVVGAGIPPLVTLYGFTTLDDAPPAVLGAVAPDRMTVQVSFYEPVAGSYTSWTPATEYEVGDVVSTSTGAFYASVATQGSNLSAATPPGPSGTGTFVDNDVTWQFIPGAPPTFAADALNPANYTITVLGGLPAVGEVADNPATSGSLNVVSVAPGYAPNIVLLTLDVPMTRAATYQVEVSNVQDLSENTAASPTNTATFVGWQSVVPGRAFNVLSWWPQINQLEDRTQDLANFLACFQEVADLLLGEIDTFLDVLDPDVAPAAWLPSMLADQGNPFGSILGALSPNDQRRLVHALVAVYQLKGTDVGVVEALNFFLGVEATVTYEALGGPPLGTAYLSPAPFAYVALASDGLDLTTLTGTQSIELEEVNGFTVTGGSVYFPSHGNAAVSFGGVSGATLTDCTLLSGAGVVSAGDEVDLLQGGDGGAALQLGAAIGTVEGLTFFVNVPTGLTAQQTANGKAIVQYMRRAGTRPVWRPTQTIVTTTPPLPLGEFSLGPGGSWSLV